MIYNNWLETCYKKNQFQLWLMNCLDENQFINVVTKKQKLKSDIELQKKIIYQIIIKNAHYVCWYVYDVLKNRPFPAGEPIIATDIKRAYWYAENVLCGPFPAGEPAISTDPKYAYYYAYFILKKRFPAGEPIIKTIDYFKHAYENRFDVKL